MLWQILLPPSRQLGVQIKVLELGVVYTQAVLLEVLLEDVVHLACVHKRTQLKWGVEGGIYDIL